MVGNDVFPKDVMLFVLSRLPVKTLKRFSCVCKSWFATFQNPYFIRNHYITNTITPSNPIHVMLKTMNPTSPITCSRNHDYYLSSSNPTMDEVSEPINLSCFQNYDFRTMLGECEGLMCMYNATSVALFNPSTREIKPLPQPCVTHVGILYALGIGYDYNTNDYKVVRLLKDYDNIGAIYHVQLYSLSTNSWKEIHYALELGQQFDGITYSNFSTYLNGCYHWLMPETKGILAFDMTQEVFQTMAFPAHLLIRTRNNEPNLRVFDGHLAFVVRSKNVSDCFEIYVMKEYGVAESWTKQLVIGPIQGVEEILGSCRGGDEWVFSTHEHDTENYRVKLYDNRTKVVRDLGKSFTAWEVEAVIFTENLLPLNCFKGQCGFFTKFKKRLANFFCRFKHQRAMAHEEPLLEYQHQTGPMRLTYEVLSITDVLARTRLASAVASVEGLMSYKLNILTRTLTVGVEESLHLYDFNKKVKRVLGGATTTLKTFEPEPPP